MRSQRWLDPGALPPDERPPRSVRLHPTPSGIVLVVGAVLFAFVGPEVNDPAIAGLVWAAVVGALVVGALWPLVIVLRTDVVAAVDSRARRSTIRVGDQVAIPVRVGARMSDVVLQWVDEQSSVVLGAGAPSVVTVPLRAARRGQFTALRLRVTCDAPFGLATATRSVMIRPPRPMVVGPPTLSAAAIPAPTVPELGDTVTSTAAASSGESVRSVRPYVVGDPAHLVHWPTTARTGTLVVRELEPPAVAGLALVVDLGPLPVPAPEPTFVMPGTPRSVHEHGAERAVAEAAATAMQVRANGGRLILCTADPEPRTSEVGDEASLMEQLAVASAGRPGTPPPGWTVQRITPTQAMTRG